MKEIIEKIEALRIKFNKEDASNISEIQRTTNNITINKAIAIFNAEFEQKVQPDCIGWWWVEKTFGKLTCVEVKEGKDGFYFFDYPMELYYADDFFTTWIKALVPEIKR